MPLVKYRGKRAGVVAILKSERVHLNLRARAERMAVVAQVYYNVGQYAHSGQVTVRADSEVRRNRARAVVIAEHPAAIAIEHDHHVLAQALDAAKG